MGDTIGSLMRHAVVAACLSLALVHPALAQGPAVEGGELQIPPAPAGGEFMSRADFHLSAGALSNDDPRFKWDTHFGGDLDVIDYVNGRVRAVIDYQAVLGSEFRAFDPNQGNYILESSGSWRVAGFELVGVFHHESRHLSDRPKRFAIAWNTLGGRVLKRVDAGQTTFEVEGGLGAIVQHAYVDYKWVGDADVLVRRPVNRHVAVYLRATGVLYGVNGDVPRDNQTGGRAEIGARLSGRAGALEVFAGFEQMVDAYPLDRVPQHWPLAGFRLVSR